MANLQAAIQAMQPFLRILGRSPVYETPPWGYADQPDFLNQVIQGETELPPLELLQRLKAIEVDLGRIPTFHNGPRLIDLDILLYDDLVLDTPDLTIPHPRFPERAFVLFPLADLAPELRYPLTGQTVRSLRDRVDSSGIHRYPHESQL
jgi:2-amino-4-hydroxy-6-hydroxymethyldihydropteridine diphosphokinase